MKFEGAFIVLLCDLGVNDSLNLLNGLPKADLSQIYFLGNGLEAYIGLRNEEIVSCDVSDLQLTNALLI